jgi:hypothetical protein
VGLEAPLDPRRTFCASPGLFSIVMNPPRSGRVRSVAEQRACGALNPQPMGLRVPPRRTPISNPALARLSRPWAGFLATPAMDWICLTNVLALEQRVKLSLFGLDSLTQAGFDFS